MSYCLSWTSWDFGLLSLALVISCLGHSINNTNLMGANFYSFSTEQHASKSMNKRVIVSWQPHCAQVTVLIIIEYCYCRTLYIATLTWQQILKDVTDVHWYLQPMIVNRINVLGCVVMGGWVESAKPASCSIDWMHPCGTKDSFSVLVTWPTRHLGYSTNWQDNKL